MRFLQRIASYFALAQLQDFFNTQFENLSFSNLLWNGAPAHRLLAVRERLPEAFDNCIVALQHKIEWPPRSLELSIFFCMEFTMRKVSVFSCIWTEYCEIRSISPYSARMQENKNRKNSEYGHFLHHGYMKSWLFAIPPMTTVHLRFASKNFLAVLRVGYNSFLRIVVRAMK